MVRTCSVRDSFAVPRLLAFAFVSLATTSRCQGFAPASSHSSSSAQSAVSFVVRSQNAPKTRHAVLPAAVASLLAGSVAGALGVGAAYPLDTIKTKAQVLAAKASSPKTMFDDMDDEDEEDDPSTPNWFDWNADGTATMSKPINIPVPGAHASMWQVANYIYHTSGGVPGFFGGVQSTMMGQAIIKAVVFAVNAAVLEYATTHHLFGDTKAYQLLAAAALAGFVTSFLAAPVDRIKVLMQCSNHECYNGDEKACMDAVLLQEGWQGLLTRGLGCTMIREIPAYSLYFGVYGGLQAFGGDLTTFLGPTWAPALYGATAGCACWLPIYPIDVIRTVALNTEGKEGDKSAWEVAVELYQASGWEAFYDGLGARLLRQAVNHGVTFSVYEVLMRIALYEKPDVFA
eukprot:scaffold8306_cov171-Amphora_coffeaeformis.AAC.15